MSNSPINWSSLLKKYEDSGLTQVEFCRRNKLVLSPFQYRRYGRHAIKKKDKISGVAETSSALALFENIRACKSQQDFIKLRPFNLKQMPK